MYVIIPYILWGTYKNIEFMHYHHLEVDIFAH